MNKHNDSHYISDIVEEWYFNLPEKAQKEIDFVDRMNLVRKILDEIAIRETNLINHQPFIDETGTKQGVWASHDINSGKEF